MSRLILPGETTPGMTILVPRGYEDPRNAPQPIAVCRVPTGEGEICGTPFYPGEERAFRRHVGRCAHEHADAIHAASPRTRLPILDENNWDPEASSHLQKVGQRMLREGRLEMKPNERVET